MFQANIISLNLHIFGNMSIINVVVVTPALIAKLLWIWKSHSTSLNVDANQYSKQHPDQGNQQKDLLCS